METLRMSTKERRRLELLGRVKSGEVTLVKAAELLSISYRQAKRLWSRFQDQGDAGLLHRLRGRASNRHVQPIRKEQALELYRDKYTGYGPTLAAECLEREDGLAVPASTLRVWLCAAGLWERKRRRKLHRRRRPRREHFGELVQMDGSHHDWFEGRRAWTVLMVMIDDATGRIFARFFENESWLSAATTLRRYTARHGLPGALYVDRFSIYRADREPTADEIIAGIEPKTQFGRAMADLEADSRPQSASQGTRGTSQSHVTRSLGERAHPRGHLGLGGCQSVSRGDIPAALQRAVWSARRSGRRPASRDDGRAGAACIGAAGGSRAAARLDRTLEQRLFAVAARRGRARATWPARGAERAVGWPTADLCGRARTDVVPRARDPTTATILAAWSHGIESGPEAAGRSSMASQPH